MIGRPSARTLDGRIPGRLLSDSSRLEGDVVVQLFSHGPIEDHFLVPAVAEPLLVWIMSGAAVVEERDIGGMWSANSVKAGDFFITDSDMPYELRWRTSGGKPFEVMHVYLGLPLLERAASEVFDASQERPVLREVSGVSDPVVSTLLEALRLEMVDRRSASRLFISSIAQSLAVQLVRSYSDGQRSKAKRRSALPAYHLRRVTEMMKAELSEEFSLARLAQAVGMSTFHFSRTFKRSTGFSPSQYFIGLRIGEARRLLRETDESIIQVGLSVGYASPSHFARIFRREVGMSPSDYRG
jgi:AraC family transcriptional regulator